MSAVSTDARRCLANESVVLAVQCHDESRLRGRSQRGHEIVGLQCRELRDAAVAKECFHADRAAFAQLAEARRIRVDEAAPEPKVDDG